MILMSDDLRLLQLTFQSEAIRYGMPGVYRNVISFPIPPPMDVDDDAIKKTKFREIMRHFSIQISLCRGWNVASSHTCCSNFVQSVEYPFNIHDGTISEIIRSQFPS